MDGARDGVPRRFQPPPGELVVGSARRGRGRSLQSLDLHQSRDAVLAVHPVLHLDHLAGSQGSLSLCIGIQHERVLLGFLALTRGNDQIGVVDGHDSPIQVMLAGAGWHRGHSVRGYRRSRPVL